MNKMKAKQNGAVSIFIVVFTALLITVITVSFVRIMMQDQQQATVIDLSRSAYDSALAGVEDAKLALLRYQNACNSGPTSADCIKSKEMINSTDCNVATSGNKANTGEVKVQTGSSNNLDQAYTCVKVNLVTNDYLGVVKPGESKLVPLVGVGVFDKVKVEWFSSDNSDGKGISVNPYGALQPGAVNTPTTLRAQIIQVSSSFKLDDFDNASVSVSAGNGGTDGGNGQNGLTGQDGQYGYGGAGQGYSTRAFWELDHNASASLYAGGGGGIAGGPNAANCGMAGAPGSGGGAGYISKCYSNPVVATANSGGGGSPTNRNGAAGVVVVRYSINPTGAVASGGVVADSGGYRTHTFTSNGIFVAPSSDMNVDVFLVGGGGGSSIRSGGGGGYTKSYGNIKLSANQSVNITVGVGGGLSGNSGLSGSYSEFLSSSYRALGGKGALYDSSSSHWDGGAGGSGGGGYGNAVGDNGSSTFFLYPQNNTGISVIPSSSDYRRTPTNSRPTKVLCVPPTSVAYSCSVEFALTNTVVGGDDSVFLRLSSIYGASTDYRVTLINSDGALPVSFNAVQPEIDSTGRANDLFKRVRTRVDLSDINFPYPSAAVETAGDFCKDFSITDNPSDYNQGSVGLFGGCNP